MGELEFCLGATWQARQAVDGAGLRSLSAEFDVDGGEPCIWEGPEGPGTVSVTWVTRLPGDGRPYEAALAEARRVAERRFRSAGLPGRLLSAEAMTEEGQVTWRADG